MHTVHLLPGRGGGQALVHHAIDHHLVVHGHEVPWGDRLCAGDLHRKHDLPNVARRAAGVPGGPGESTVRVISSLHRIEEVFGLVPVPVFVFKFVFVSAHVQLQHSMIATKLGRDQNQTVSTVTLP